MNCKSTLLTLPIPKKTLWNVKYKHLVHIICTMTELFLWLCHVFVTLMSCDLDLLHKSERHAESSSVLTPPHVTSACDHEDLPRNCLQKAHWCTFSSTKLPWKSTWPCLGVSFRADDFHLVGSLWSFCGKNGQEMALWNVLWMLLESFPVCQFT